MMPPCCVVPYRLPALSKTIVPQKCAPWFGLGRYKIFVLPPPQAGITRKRATQTTAQTRANEVENRRGIARRTDMGVLLSAGGKLDGKPATAKPAAQMLDLSWGLCKGNRCRVVAQFDDAPSKPEPRRTQSATKLFVLRLSFVDLRALCGRCFGFPSWTFVPFVVDVLAFLRGPSCPLWWTFWQNEPLPPDLERDVRRPRPQAGAVKMPLPIHQFRAQFVEIEIGKRALAPTKIPQSAGQNRTRADKVASRVMMKSDRQLNQPLQMQPEPPTRSRVAR